MGILPPSRIRLTSMPPVAIHLKQIIKPAKVAALGFLNVAM
jgi:hypothetical protein